jgi:hypothetical protein
MARSQNIFICLESSAWSPEGTSQADRGRQMPRAWTSERPDVGPSSRDGRFRRSDVARTSSPPPLIAGDLEQQVVPAARPGQGLASSRHPGAADPAADDPGRETAAGVRRAGTRRRTSTPPDTRSSSRSSPTRTGVGATFTASSSSSPRSCASPGADGPRSQLRFRPRAQHQLHRLQTGRGAFPSAGRRACR